LVSMPCWKILWKNPPWYIWSLLGTHYALFLCGVKIGSFSRFYRFQTNTIIILLSTLLYDDDNMSSYVRPLNKDIWSLFTYNKLYISFKKWIYKEQNINITLGHNNIIIYYYDIIMYVIMTIISYLKVNV